MVASWSEGCFERWGVVGDGLVGDSGGGDSGGMTADGVGGSFKLGEWAVGGIEGEVGFDRSAIGGCLALRVVSGTAAASIVLRGLSAGPLADRYTDWFAGRARRLSWALRPGRCRVGPASL